MLTFQDTADSADFCHLSHYKTCQITFTLHVSYLASILVGEGDGVEVTDKKADFQHL